MKKIFINLKRFDIPRSLGGISFSDSVLDYGKNVIDGLRTNYSKNLKELVVFLPEAHLITANKAKKDGDIIMVGCQGVFREDIAYKGNFGAFTTNHTAVSMKALGCNYALIGHTEERKDKAGILLAAGIEDKVVVSKILNSEVKCAIKAGLKVLFCVGETTEEMEIQEQVISDQLRIGLENIDLSEITIAYEPVWAIGPGKIPPDRDYIQKTAQMIKNYVSCDVVYGGGLKIENSEMLASIPEIDGCLIGLTRFTGDFGFYPDECIDIIKKYIGEE
jgi:triosephosphate isomerase (TIM)